MIPNPRRAGVCAAAVALLLTTPDAALAAKKKDRKDKDKGPPPAAPRNVKVAGGEDWRRSGNFTVRWSNPEHSSRIATAHFRLCPVEGQANCLNGSQPQAGSPGLRLALPRAGDWTLTVWLGDDRGNADDDTRSAAVHLRFDDRPPTSSGLETGGERDPTLLRVAVADELSGPKEGDIQVRRDGSDWRSLSTDTSDPARLTARVPDTELDDGTYDVRAVVRDVAGNSSVVERDTRGRQLQLELPLRRRTRITGTAQTSRGTPAGRPVPLGAEEPLRLAAAEGVAINGELQEASEGGTVEIIERPRTPGLPEARSEVEVDGSGHFQAQLPPGPSRMVELRFAGSAQALPSRITTSVLVPAAGTLEAGRTSLRNGETVRFTGRLLGPPIPEGGRTVDLQAYYRGAWRTFATPRTDGAGAWVHDYRFGATRGRVVYRFRVLIQREAGYPYELGFSRVVRVTVRG